VKFLSSITDISMFLFLLLTRGRSRSLASAVDQICRLFPRPCTLFSTNSWYT